MAGLVLAVAVAACGAVTVHPAAGRTGSIRYVDPRGWSLRYPRSLSLERSTSGPGMATFTEDTLANFAQRRAVVTGRTRDGGYILVRPPLNRAGRFPADGVAFRMLSIDGGPALIGTVADSSFPIELSTFSRPQDSDFRPSDYRALGVPHERSRAIDADGQHYQALLFIGPAASARARSAIEAVVASLVFPPVHPGESAGDEVVLGAASSYPVGLFTLIHVRGEVCDGSVYRCRPGLEPFYLVHAPGRLHQPDLIQPCEPTPAACSPPGAFYALGWKRQDVLGGYRSGCRLRFDRRLEQFWCTNSSARWDQTGRVIRRPPGARFADGLQFAFAKVSWDGHVVFLPGLGGNPPRDPARRLLWPRLKASAAPGSSATTNQTIRATAASCAALTPAQQFDAAKAVFNGRALAGPVAPHTGGVLASPARMRVERYLKGQGPAIVTVQTAIKTLNAGAVVVAEDGIQPHAGERWRIYTSSASEPYATSICLGSQKLPPRTHHFSGGGVSFDYPASWHARTYLMPPAPFSSWIVWLSPQRMHPPCVTRHGTHNKTITCGDPVSRLALNSILADWTSNANPSWRFGQARGTPITVGGRAGRWQVTTRTSDAPRLGETEVITVVVATPGMSDSWHQLTAFLRGPDIVRLEQQIRAMLRSVHWLAGRSTT